MAASAGGIRAGKAYVEIGAILGPLDRGLKQASAKLTSWGQSVTALGKRVAAVGSVALGGFLAATRQFARAGDTIQKMSLRTGLSAEALSELEFAANRSGASLEYVEHAIRMMQKNLGSGSTGLTEALGQLGLSLESLQGLSPEDQFTILADAIGRVEDDTKRAALAMAIFGRTGTMILPMVADAGATIAELRAEARRLGLTMTTEEANAAAAITDAMQNFSAVLKRIVFTIGGQLAPVLTEFANRLTALIAPVSRLIADNQGLVKVMFLAAAATTATGIGLMGLGLALKGAGAGLRVISTLLQAGIAAFNMLFAAIGALLTPIGLVLTALAGLATYAIYMSGVWQTIFDYIGKGFQWVSDIAIKAWHGISAALAAGDITLAAQIAIAGLKIAWYEALAWIKGKWLAFKNAIITTWYDAVYGIAQMALTGFAAVQTTWVNLQTGIRRLWAQTMKFLGDAWDAVYSWLAKAFVNLTHAFASAAETAAAKKAIDEEAARRAAERERETRQRLADIEREGSQRQQKIDEGLMDTLATLEEDKKRAMQSALEDEAEGVEDLKKQAEEAKKEFDDLTQKAEKLAAEGAPQMAAAPELPQLPKTAELERRLTGLGGGAAGTFSALAARGLAMSGPWDRIAKASEITADNTRRMIKLLEQDQAEFV
jgi:hypothetical protein